FLAKPAAMLVEVQHAPVEQQQEENEQPNRDCSPGSQRFGGVGQGRHRLLQLSIHFAGAFVGAALVAPPSDAGALVAAGGGAGTVNGATKSGASARRLAR